MITIPARHDTIGYKCMEKNISTKISVNFLPDFLYPLELHKVPVGIGFLELR